MSGRSRMLMWCVAMLASVSACGGPLRSQDFVDAVGWTPDGRILVAASAYERPATLWMAEPGENLRRVPFDYCEPIQVWSVFRRSSGRVGLTVWCAEPHEPQLVALDLVTGRVELLGAAAWITDGFWPEALSAGLVEYSAGTCQGVGELDRSGVIRPLMAGFPQPGDSGCAASALARWPAVAPGGRYLAYFLHSCDGRCTGEGEFEGAWRVTVQDRVTGHVEVSASTFARPHGLAVSDGGTIAVSARLRDTTGIWFCPSPTCAEPRRVATGAFQSPDFRADGTMLVAVEIGEKEPRLIDLA